MRSNSKRKNLLDAASYLVEHEGMENLTLEAVANKAGVSKGGLLYHFPSKDALIKGMINEYSKAFIEDVRTRSNDASDSIGKWHRAYLESALKDEESSNKLITAYVASLFTDPVFLSKIDEEYHEISDEMATDGLDPVEAAIIRLAIDGLWYSGIFNVGKLNHELKQKVIERLLEMTKQQ
ncbi:TetR/AcrR family transcriptional regulator [Paenibacillus pasadenensis]|uniref:TetR/AcrR family transcriptional regulator n=1 Tax=Paenibacillus pasadenensis TaxID=217090 RepID=UPI000410A505|nr:TetR/AcrR family transcriptional regulator [Paenibacillus pasadenensis]